MDRYYLNPLVKPERRVRCPGCKQIIEVSPYGETRCGPLLQFGGRYLCDEAALERHLSAIGDPRTLGLYPSPAWLSVVRSWKERHPDRDKAPSLEKLERIQQAHATAVVLYARGHGRG